MLGLGHAVEAHCVRRISNVRVNAGYDIESFDGPSPPVAYDRFIEVKGAKSDKLRFFWSDNEIKVAKKLGKRYWIYFQGSVDVKNGVARDEPIPADSSPPGSSAAPMSAHRCASARFPLDRLAEFNQEGSEESFWIFWVQATISVSHRKIAASPQRVGRGILWLSRSDNGQETSRNRGD